MLCCKKMYWFVNIFLQMNWTEPSLTPRWFVVVGDFSRLNVLYFITAVESKYNFHLLFTHRLFSRFWTRPLKTSFCRAFCPDQTCHSNLFWTTWKLLQVHTNRVRSKYTRRILSGKNNTNFLGVTRCNSWSTEVNWILRSKLWYKVRVTLAVLLLWSVSTSWCLNISSWCNPILGTMSFPTTTLVMKDWLASMAASLEKYKWSDLTGWER